jgi:NADH:ubiquinone oxidoreductase subunit F (NADH-binding)
MIMTESRRVDRRTIDPDRVLAMLATTDLRGHGGGWFPTATKIAAARGDRPELIVNACDGEPLVGKDATLLARRPLLVADGIAILQAILRPRRTLVAVHHGTGDTGLAEVLRAVDSEVLVVPPRYVSSEASALASLAAGGDARPVHRDVPLTSRGPGRRHRPVLVLNAETVARIAAVVLRGTATPTRLLSVAGHVRRPAVLEAAETSRIADLVLGGGPTAPPRAVLVGGYGGRWHPWSELAERTVGELSGELGAGLIMVDAVGCPLRTVADVLAYLADQTAGQCGPCMFGLPAVAEDWRALLDPRAAVEAEWRLRRRLPVLRGRGACHHPDGAVTMAASALVVFETDLVAHRSGRCVGHGALVGQGTGLSGSPGGRW